MTTTSTDPAAALVDGIVSALFTGGEEAAQVYITAELPIFASPILSTLLSYFLGLIGNSIEKNVVNLANQIVFNVQADNENSAVLKAANALQAAQKAGDQNAITQGKQNLINAIGSLVHTDTP